MKPYIFVYMDFMNFNEEKPKYKKYLDSLKIEYKISELPEFNIAELSKYSHIFLDYGGLNLPGNDLFATFNSDYDKIIGEMPSKYFVFISTFGKDYYEDDITNSNEPNVIFMNDFFDKKELKKILEL